MKQNRIALVALLALVFGGVSGPTRAAIEAVDAAVVAAARQVDERWQPERFGPIKSTDTLWSIAMYYSDNTDLSVYEMMDLFVELNPRAFVDNHPSRMLDGFYLRVPDVAQQAVRARLAKLHGDQQRAEQPQAEQPPTVVTDTVTFEREELAQLRGQLAESIELIERLNHENAQLQERLDSVRRELQELRLKVDAEQAAEDELQQQLAAEMAATKEALQPAASNTASQRQAGASKTSSSPDSWQAFRTWLQEPLQLTLAILIVALLLVIMIAVIMLRRAGRVSPESTSVYHQAIQAAEKEQQAAVAPAAIPAPEIAAPVEPEATESNAAEAEPVVASDIELPVNEAEANAFIEIETLLEEAEAAANNTESSRFEREAGQIDDTDETPWGLIHLARFYLEVNDLDAARTELEKVATSDDEDAKREAAMLLQQINVQERE